MTSKVPAESVSTRRGANHLPRALTAAWRGAHRYYLHSQVKKPDGGSHLWQVARLESDGAWISPLSRESKASAF